MSPLAAKPVTQQEMDTLEKRIRAIKPWKLSRDDQRELISIRKSMADLKFRQKWAKPKK